MRVLSVLAVNNQVARAIIRKLHVALWPKRLDTPVLGNAKSRFFHAGVEDSLEASRKMGCRISLKMHFVHFYLNFFPENFGAVSDEQGQRFYLGVQAKEACYQGF